MGKAGERILRSIHEARAWARGGTTEGFVVHVPSDHYTYRVAWSEEDQKFVGTCVEFPNLSHLAVDREEALVGIQELVRDAGADMPITNS